VRNYRDFVGFVFSTTLLAAFVGSSCVRGLVDHALLSREGPSVVLEAGGAPILGPAVSVILLLYCAVVFFTTFGLLGYHLCLIAKNQTTNEDLKKVYQNVRRRTPPRAAVPCSWDSWARLDQSSSLFCWRMSVACCCQVSSVAALHAPLPLSFLHEMGSRLSETPAHHSRRVHFQVPNLHDQGCLRNFRSKLCTKRRRSVVTTPRSDEDLEQMALVPCLPGTVDRNSIL
jgi:hypothetical protein